MCDTTPYSKCVIFIKEILKSKQQKMCMFRMSYVAVRLFLVFVAVNIVQQNESGVSKSVVQNFASSNISIAAGSVSQHTGSTY